MESLKKGKSKNVSQSDIQLHHLHFSAEIVRVTEVLSEVLKIPETVSGGEIRKRLPEQVLNVSDSSSACLDHTTPSAHKVLA